MVKQIKVWGCDWYKNDDKLGGAQYEAIKACKKDEIVICSITQRQRVWTHIKPEKALTLIKKNYGLYEVLSHYPKKVYFDIDCKRKNMQDHSFNEYIRDPNQYLTRCTDLIHTHFPNAQLAVSGSIREHAISYHIILTNYLIRSPDELCVLKHIVKTIKSTEPTFDIEVYKKNNLMKMVNQSKPDDDRIQSIIQNNNIKDHFISSFFQDEVLPFPRILQPDVDINVKKEQCKLPINLLSLPKLNKIKLSAAKQDLLDNYELEQMTSLQLLQLMPLDHTFNHSYTWRMCLFAYFNEISFEQFIEWYRQKHDDDIYFKKYKSHWDNAHQFTPPSIGQVQKILVYFYPKLGKDIFHRQFCNTFELDASRIKKIDTITQDNYKLSQCVIFNTGMGSGKTHQTIDYLAASETSFCWICPNRALAHNTQTRLQAKQIDSRHYESFNRLEKQGGIFDNIDHLIIVANSLHYIKTKTYDTIVIDEIETLLDKWEGSFINNGGKKLDSWKVFINIMNSAKKIILLDAFVTTKTIHFLHAIGIQDYIIFERVNEPTTRQVNYISQYESMLKMIMDDLKANKKIFIFYPYKDGTSKYMSMMTLANVLEQACGVSGSYYNADVDDAIKDDVKNVNFSWLNKQFIITNNMITCGVNFDTTDPSQQFDKKYIFIASMNLPRDIIQVSYRARALKDNTLYVCFLGRMLQNNIWEDDTETTMNKCPIYKILYRDILVERKAPLRKSFYFFCSKAHYIQHAEKKEQLNEDLNKEIADLITKHNIDFDFSLVCNITFQDAERLRQKVISHDASMTDKIELKKYYFMQRFDPSSYEIPYWDAIPQGGVAPTETILEFLWNNKYTALCDKLFQAIDKENSVFKTLQTTFDWQSIFPEEINNKLKLDDKVKQMFFDQFQYKFLSMKSNLPHLLCTTYNSYFGKEIVTKKIANKNTSYFIDTENLVPIYKFCIEHRHKLENKFISSNGKSLIEIDDSVQ